MENVIQVKVQYEETGPKILWKWGGCRDDSWVITLPVGTPKFRVSQGVHYE